MSDVLFIWQVESYIFLKLESFDDLEARLYYLKLMETAWDLWEHPFLPPCVSFLFHLSFSKLEILRGNGELKPILLGAFVAIKLLCTL